MKIFNITDYNEDDHNNSFANGELEHSSDDNSWVLLLINIVKIVALSWGAFYLICEFTSWLLRLILPPRPSRDAHDEESLVLRPPPPSSVPFSLFEQLGRQQWDPEMDKTTCTVCLEDFAKNDSIRILKCSHGFHTDCIDAWLIRSFRCPNCNQLIPFPIQKFDDSEGELDDEDYDSEFDYELAMEELGLSDMTEEQARMFWEYRREHLGGQVPFIGYRNRPTSSGIERNLRDAYAHLDAQRMDALYAAQNAENMRAMNGHEDDIPVGNEHINIICM